MYYSGNIGLKGFSLVQMAMLVAVAGIILAAMLPGGERASEAGKQAITLRHMEAIEKATQAFMAQNLRRPCPADGTLALSSANFGLEASYPGVCTGGTIAANFTDTQAATGTWTTSARTVTSLSTLVGVRVGAYVTGTGIASNTFVVSIDSSSQITLDKTPTSAGTGGTLRFTTITAGTVPVRSLGLPDEYALDGYGRRIMYMVDRRATAPYSTSSVTPATPPVPAISFATKSCFDMQSQGMPGAIPIFDNSTDATASPPTNIKDYTMWALISYGKAGHGAFPANGSAIASRIDVSEGTTSIVPTAGLLNAFINPSTAFTTQFLGKLVQQDPVEASPHNTTVWYSQETKNTCCVGKLCSRGFDIKHGGTFGTPNDASGVNLATGDFNGDGITDLAMAVNEYGSANPSEAVNRVYVIYGRKTGWPIPLSSTANVITDIDAATDGVYGFSLRNNSGTISNFANSVAMGDVNRDGYDDLIVGGNNITIVFGEANLNRNSVRTDLFTGTNNAATPSIASTYGMQITYGGTPGQVITADIAGTGYKSIVFSDTTNNVVWVVYDSATINSNGSGTPKIWNISAAGFTSGYGFKFTTPTARYPLPTGLFSYAAGDVDGDGYDDLIIGASTANNSIDGVSGTGKVYVLLSPFTPAGGPPAEISISSGVTWGASVGSVIMQDSEVEFGLTVAAADLNNDGYKDVITASEDNVYFYYGKASASWDASTTTASAQINTSDNRPTAWLTGTFPRVIKTGDLNNDGKQDLLLSTYESSAPSGCSKGANTGSVYVLLQPPIDGFQISNLNLFDSTNTTCDASELNMEEFSAGGIDCADTTGTPSLCGFRIDGATTGDYAYIPAVGDLNADGKNDIFIAAPGWSTTDGIAYTLWGRKNTNWDDVIDLNTITSQ